jgi:peptide/nickel transport system substrate-binding protein
VNNKKRIAFVALGLALTMVAAACGGSSNNNGPTTGTGTTPTKGGVFRVGWVAAFNFDDGFDPSGEYLGDAWGVDTNLLLRTLVSYPHTSGPAGDKLVPDLATSVPTPTNGGKTYTFTLKNNIKFGEPVNREITSKDIYYAFQRIATKSVNALYSFYYDPVIVGMQDYADGKAKTISGIQTPDDKTIVFNLVKPYGDFLYRLGMMATAPIPQEIAKCFTGAGEYGRYVISSGPYEIKGSDKLSTSSCSAMKPISGFDPNKILDLVRNPNYVQSTDSYRKNYPNEFQFEVNTNINDIYNKTAGSEYETQVATEPPQVIRKYETNSQLKPLFKLGQGDRTWYLNFDLTQPPFDDIHVRKAVNWVMDKTALQRAWGGVTAGQVATHIMPPTLTGGHPTAAEYDPYATPNESGDVNKAKAEIKLSKYDSNHDGLCDASACKNILMFNRNVTPWTAMEPAIQASLQKIGITVNPREFADFYTPWDTIAKTSPIAAGAGWGKDYPDPSTFVGTLFTSGSILAVGNTNVPLVGLTPALAQSTGITKLPGRTITGIPSVDADAAKCTPLSGTARTACWVALDKTLMENVVPWVPYLWSGANYVVAPDVTAYDFDQFSTTAAWSKVAVDPSKEKGL